MAWQDPERNGPPNGPRDIKPVPESDPDSPRSAKGFSAELPKNMQLLNLSDPSSSTYTQPSGQEHEDQSPSPVETTMPPLSSTSLGPNSVTTDPTSSVLPDLEMSSDHQPIQADEPNDPLFALRNQYMREKAVSVPSSEGRTSLEQELGSSWGSVTSAAEYGCHKCKIYRSGFPSTESYDFWQSVDSMPSCHEKYFKTFLQRLKDRFPVDDGLLQDKRICNFLRVILHVPESDDAAEVQLKDFVRLVRFFGPVCEDDEHRCILLTQLKIIIEKSLQIKDPRTKEKVSWFAGDIKRDEAEKLLKDQKDSTYLVRMSQSNADNGNFAISVKYGEDIHHFEIQGHPDDAVKSKPFSANLEFHERRFSSLPEVIEEIKTHPLSPDDNPDEQIWCRFICPALPLNSQICGYKKSRSRR